MTRLSGLNVEIFGATIYTLQAPLAQLDRASVYGTEGYWFESSGV